MPRSPLTLAALATVAVSGLDAVDVRRPRNPSAGVDAAVVIDAEGNRWVVRAPQNATVGAALEAETALLGGLAAHVDAGRLPFDVSRPAGFVDLPDGGRAVVSRQLPGRALHLEDLGPGPGLAAEVGRAIAAIHELPPSTVEDAGLPVYEADEYRRRRLSEVDEAAKTGRVPTSLLRRWERALEDVAVWRFRPVVVHGDLSADHILCNAERPLAVLGWSEAKVADPADDLAWLLVAAPHEAVDAIIEAYNLRRTELRDPYLGERALLAGELALARWLLHGVHMEDQAIIDDATAMLTELAEQTAEDETPGVVLEGAWAPAAEAWPADDDELRAGEEAQVDEAGVDEASDEAAARAGEAEPGEAGADGTPDDAVADAVGDPVADTAADGPSPDAEGESDGEPDGAHDDSGTPDDDSGASSDDEGPQSA